VLMYSCMHFEIDLESISKAASFANAVAKAAGSLADTGNPDHKSIYLSSTPQGLIVRCTTRDYQASTLLKDANVFSHGDCMLFSERLSGHLETLPIDSRVTFIYDSGLLQIESDKRKGNRSIPAIIPDYAMPEWRLESDHFTQVVPPDFAQDLLHASKYACVDQTRDHYGINIDATGIMAFDNYNFVKIPKTLPSIPSTTLDSDVVKFISSPKFFGDGDISFSSDGDKFKFQFGNSALMGPTMAGNFEASRVQMEALVAPYIEPPQPRKLVFDYKKFGSALDSITASSLDPLDRVLIWPNGNVCIGIDRIDNYNEKVEVLECGIKNPFAVSLKSLLAIFKEGKDDNLTFNFHPTHDKPEIRQIVVIQNNKVIGFSPSVVSDSIIGKTPDVGDEDEVEKDIQPEQELLEDSTANDEDFWND